MDEIRINAKSRRNESYVTRFRKELKEACDYISDMGAACYYRIRTPLYAVLIVNFNENSYKISSEELKNQLNSIFDWIDFE